MIELSSTTRDDSSYAADHLLCAADLRGPDRADRHLGLVELQRKEPHEE
jgi:hypothetical protein